MNLTLVSHSLCPYVQRAAIVMLEKRVGFDRRYVDLSNKPDWFKAISPLGKTPVLLVDEKPLFESAVICEYLDECFEPRLHPQQPFPKAEHRAWMEFGSTVLNTIGAFYSAADEHALQSKAKELHTRFSQLEQIIGAGPYFEGERFCMVDAVFGRVFRYFDVFDSIANFGCLTGLPKVEAWRKALSARASVKDAVQANYNDQLMAFLINRQSALSARILKAYPN